MKFFNLVLTTLVISGQFASAKTIVSGITPFNSAINSSAIKVNVNVNEMSGHHIDKSFYGSHIDSSAPLPSTEMMKDLGLGMIRVGGNSYDVYNWKSSTAMVSDQRGAIRLHTYVALANKFKEYGVSGVFQINLTGYQPVKEGSKYVMKRNFNAKEVGQLIKYLNGTKRLGIKNFSLGNEFAQWHETHPHIFGSEDGFSADEFIDRYIETAIAMRKAQHRISGNPNTIKLWGPEFSASWVDWNTNNFAKDCEYTDIPGQVECSYGGGAFKHFLPYFFARLKTAEANKKINPKGYKLLDYMAFHYYPNFRTNINDIDSIVKDANGKQRVADILEATRLLHDEKYTNTIDLSSFKNYRPNILGRMNKWLKTYSTTAKLAINEFALDSDYRSFGYHPAIRPLYMADLIGISTTNNVSFFNRFILNSSKYSPVPWALIQEGTRKTDLYYMYKLFSNNFKGSVIKVSDNGGDSVNTYALRTGKQVKLLVVNKNPSPRNIDIYLNFGQGKKKVSSYNIPGWSSSILTLNTNPRANDRYNYVRFGAEEMGIELDAAYEKRN